MARRHGAGIPLSHAHRRAERLAFWDARLVPRFAIEAESLFPMVLAAEPRDAPLRHSITRLQADHHRRAALRIERVQATIHARRPPDFPAAPA